MPKGWLKLCLIATPLGVPNPSQPDKRRRVGVVLFDRFQLLDVFVPLELFGVLRDRFELLMIRPTAGPVRSAQGPQVVADAGYGEVTVTELASAVADRVESDWHQNPPRDPFAANTAWFERRPLPPDSHGQPI